MGNVESIAPTKAKAADEREIQRCKRDIKRRDQNLRIKLRGGVLYNMKMVIRGCRRTGKTSLMRRLQGLPFEDEYTATPEIQTASINWSFKNAEEAVCVEVWDVVDEGIIAKPRVEPKKEDDMDAIAGLPGISKRSKKEAKASVPLDARVVDIYKDAQVCIFMVDPWRRPTLDYVLNELRQDATNELPVLVLVNFRDKIHEATTPPPEEKQEEKKSEEKEEKSEEKSTKEVAAKDAVGDDDDDGSEKPLSLEEVIEALAPLRQSGGEKKNLIHIFDCCMANCFGLKMLYNYLNLPFLELKRKNIEKTILDLELEALKAHSEVQKMVKEDVYDDYLGQVQAAHEKQKARKEQMQQPSPAVPGSMDNMQLPMVTMALEGTPPPPPSERRKSARNGFKLDGDDDDDVMGDHGNAEGGEPDRMSHKRDKKAAKAAKKREKKRKQKEALQLKTPAQDAKTRTEQLSSQIERDQDDSRMVSVDDVSSLLTRTQTSETLDDFFGSESSDDEFESRQSRRGKERITSYLRPEARISNGNKNGTGNGKAGEFSDSDDSDEGPGARPSSYGLSAYGAKPAKSTTRKTSTERASPKPLSLGADMGGGGGFYSDEEGTPSKVEKTTTDTPISPSMEDDGVGLGFATLTPVKEPKRSKKKKKERGSRPGGGEEKSEKKSKKKKKEKDKDRSRKHKTKSSSPGLL